MSSGPGNCASRIISASPIRNAPPARLPVRNPTTRPASRVTWTSTTTSKIGIVTWASPIQVDTRKVCPGPPAVSRSPTITALSNDHIGSHVGLKLKYGRSHSQFWVW